MPIVVISQDMPVPTRHVGIADIVGFGTTGVSILRNSFNQQSVFVLADFGLNAGGWTNDSQVRLVGDTTGDGATDIIGFGSEGVFVSPNNGANGFGNPQLVMADFGLNQGWTVTNHIRFAADLRKKGCVDLVGFGDNGVTVSLNNGSGNFATPIQAINDFGFTNGWQIARHLRFLADTTGSGILDIVGFGETAVSVALGNGDGTFQPAKSVLSDMCIGSGGWQVGQHPRFVADLTGKGRGDLIGFGQAGVVVSLNNGDGTFSTSKNVLGNYGASQGWDATQNPRYIADLTGNGRGDIIGFAAQGVTVSYGNGDGTFTSPAVVLLNFGANQGWDGTKHLRFVVDVTGDGRADIVGFGENGVMWAPNDGNGGFGAAQTLTTAFGYNAGQWSLDQTVRFMANLYT